MQSLAPTVLTPASPLTRSNLDAALRGYTYQDAVVCYLMLQAVRRQEGALTANKVVHSNDKFDDVAIADSKGHVRRQIKYSSGTDRHFARQDLTTKKNRARIDDLVRSHQNAEGATADEYRLWYDMVNTLR